MSYIELGKHKIEVCVSTNGIRMINPIDAKELLGLEDEQVGSYFIDAKVITDTLFDKIYVSNNASKEQKVIFQALCIVGIYSLIDEVCKVDLRDISYVEDFNKKMILDLKGKVWEMN